MFLGSCIAKGARVSISTRLASTPREPLLFLYPAWSSPIASACSEQTRTWKEGRHKRLGDRREFHHIASLGNDNPQAVKPQLAVPSSQDLDDYQGHRADVNAIDTTQTPQINSEASSIGNQKLKKKPPNRLESADINSIVVPGKGKLAVATTDPRFKARVRRVLNIRKQSEKRKTYNYEVQKQKQEESRIQRQAEITDWRKILATLIEHTPENGKWLDKALYLSIPHTHRQQALEGVDDNVHDIVVNLHGCSLSRQNPHGKGDLHFILSGPTSGLARSVQDVLRIAPTAKFERISKDIDSIMSIETEGVEFNQDVVENKDSVQRDRDPFQTRMTRNVADINPPTKWTKKSFDDYIRHLTSARMPNHIHRLVYDKQKDHIETTVEVISKAFIDPSASSAISRKAFNRAMQWFVKKNRIFDARSLFVRMEIAKLPMDTETFNIMLRGAAKVHDMSNFRTILNMMIQRQHVPNGRTFIAFLMVVTNIRIKAYIISAMQEKGLLNHRPNLQGTCEHIVGDSIEASLQNSQSEDVFMKQMDQEYGQDWLTINSSNRILHALASRWLISRCWDFILVMKSRSIQPDTVSLNTILHNCKNMKNTEGAVEVIKVWSSTMGKLPLDETSFQALFDMAWRGRFYNVAKIVWKYACLEAATTVKMRSKVWHSLRVGVGLEYVPSRDLWRRDQALLRKESNSDALLPSNESLTSSKATTSSNGIEVASQKDGKQVGDTQLNRFGHVSNPNNVTKTFDRTIGVFIFFMAKGLNHPAAALVKSKGPESATHTDKEADKMAEPLHSVDHPDSSGANLTNDKPDDSAVVPSNTKESQQPTGAPAKDESQVPVGGPVKHSWSRGSIAALLESLLPGDDISQDRPPFLPKSLFDESPDEDMIRESLAEEKAFDEEAIKQKATEIASIQDAPTIGDVMSKDLAQVHLHDSPPTDKKHFTKEEKEWFIKREMDRDLHIGKKWKPTVSFEDALSQALEKDMSWRHKDVYEEAKSLAWMVRNSDWVSIEKRHAKHRTSMTPW